LLIRLAAPTGEIADILDKPEDAPDRAVRSAILIHSGPDGESNDLSASNGDISFDEARIRDVISSHNAMINGMVTEYGGFDKTPVGAYPPVLDQHNDDSNDRIRGRLTGLLKFERRDVPKVGRNVACAVSDITFLGTDTVSKVKCGLIYHLSVGINEDSNTLGEVSCVIEPAAPGAMVLKKGLKKLALQKINYKGQIIEATDDDNTPDGSIKYTFRIGGPGKKISDYYPSMDAAVSAAKKLIDQGKQLKGATVSKIKLAELKKLSGKLTTLAKETSAKRELLKLAKRKIEVKSKFTKLMSDKKLTPAQFKTIDSKKLTRLSKLDDETLDIFAGIISAGDNKITSGQQGSVAASNFSDVTVGTAEDREVKRLKLAAKKNLAKSGLKFAELKDDGPDDEPIAADRKELSLPSLDNTQALDETDKPEDDQGVQDTEEMAQQIEENATQIARVASMVETIIDKMGGADEPESDESELSDESEDDDKKELSDDDKKDDDKKDKPDDDKKDEGTK
jgi:hypothetical protein